jgi:hypothetical protein
MNRAASTLMLFAPLPPGVSVGAATSAAPAAATFDQPEEWKICIGFRPYPDKKKRPVFDRPLSKNGAGEETRTLDVHLGKVVLYQLSYARVAGCKGVGASVRPSTAIFVKSPRVQGRLTATGCFRAASSATC